jgi:hypothetical protein
MAARVGDRMPPLHEVGRSSPSSAGASPAVQRHAPDRGPRPSKGRAPEAPSATNPPLTLFPDRRRRWRNAPQPGLGITPRIAPCSWFLNPPA